MSKNRIVVVTGSNRGIGRGIVELLSKTQHQPAFTIYATSRSGVDLNIQPAHGNAIHYARLDITSKDSILAFLAATLEDNGPIDVLINNAAVSYVRQETPELAAETLDVNYHGTKQTCQLFLSRGGMAKNKGSRIVNVTATQLSKFGPSLEEQFHSATSISELDALASSYVSDMQAGNKAQEDAGWGSGPRSYQVSKFFVNALTAVLAKENPEVLINCACPGWTDTDMGAQAGAKAPKSPEEGARVPVRCAVGDLSSGGNEDGGLGKNASEYGADVSGKFFANDVIVGKGWGRVKEW